MPSLKQSKPFIRFVIKPLIWLLLGFTALQLILGIYLSDLGPDPVETLLHETGLWALNSLIATLLIRPISSIFNWPLLITTRRLCGLFVFFYATAHIWIFIQFILGFDWRMIASEIIERPYITLGFIAWLLLVPLAVTSTKGAKRRMGRNWLKLHLLTYAIAILAVWHFYWQVKLDISEPIYYGLTLLMLFGWRYWQYLKKRPN
jgi:methionine sulfoxide reductase heme-binding subunit